ncbi:MAG: MBL fold metallo-hydrolase [Vagococcus salmoninarum]|uniref:MBL fold metallo-hydrolase n=1 Tax=Vagococcus salmoninarum TaxID=2739 RepID=UPI003F9A9A38
MIKIKVFGSGSLGNSYLIDDGYSQLVIECGISLKKALPQMNHDFSKVAGVLISHEHRDHCKYVKSIITETAADVYATKGTREAMFSDDKLKLTVDDRYRFNTLTYKETVKVGTWYVTPFKTEHDVAEPCGFMIDNTSGDRLVFLTDSYYVKYKFPNVTHLMVEMNFDEEVVDQKLTAKGFEQEHRVRLKQSHFSSKNALKFIKENKGPRLLGIWLLHLSDANSVEQKFKSDTQKLTGVPVYIA